MLASKAGGGVVVTAYFQPVLITRWGFF